LGDIFKKIDTFGLDFGRFSIADLETIFQMAQLWGLMHVAL